MNNSIILFVISRNRLFNIIDKNRLFDNHVNSIGGDETFRIKENERKKKKITLYIIFNPILFYQ